VVGSRSMIKSQGGNILGDCSGFDNSFRKVHIHCEKSIPRCLESLFPILFNWRA
jgi:hypothetical protein